MVKPALVHSNLQLKRLSLINAPTSFLGQACVWSQENIVTVMHEACIVYYYATTSPHIRRAAIGGTCFQLWLLLTPNMPRKKARHIKSVLQNHISYCQDTWPQILVRVAVAPLVFVLLVAFYARLCSLCHKRRYTKTNPFS